MHLRVRVVQAKLDIYIYIYIYTLLFNAQFIINVDLGKYI